MASDGKRWEEPNIQQISSMVPGTSTNIPQRFSKHPEPSPKHPQHIPKYSPKHSQTSPHISNHSRYAPKHHKHPQRIPKSEPNRPQIDTNLGLHWPQGQCKKQTIRKQTTVGTKKLVSAAWSERLAFSDAVALTSKGATEP